MANTLERLRSVAKHYEIRADVCPGVLHPLLNRLDHAAGIVTHGGTFFTDFGWRCLNPVGARLRQHEEHLAQEEESMRKSRFYFWLGCEG